MRNVVQHLVAPEFKSLAERMKGLDRKMEDLEKCLSTRFDAAYTKMDGTDQVLNAKISLKPLTVLANQATVLHILDIDKRMERLEVKSIASAS